MLRSTGIHAAMVYQHEDFLCIAHILYTVLNYWLISLVQFYFTIQSLSGMLNGLFEGRRRRLWEIRNFRLAIYSGRY